MTLPINNPALHVFVFAPLGTGTAAVHSPLAHTWTAASKLGLTEPVAGHDLGVELPGELPGDDVWFRIVAAKADAHRKHAAVVFTAHDVAAVAVRLRGSANQGWDELSDCWHEAAGDQDFIGTFGGAYIFAGASDQSAAALSESASETARKILTRNGPTGLELSAVVEPGIALWDMEMPWGRSVVALAERECSQTTSEWCWLTAASDDVGKLVRYFMHASKLRFEMGVFQDGIARFRDKKSEIDKELAELFTLHEQFEASGVVANELIDAQSRLGRFQGDAAGLLIFITQLRDLRQTVHIAAHNMRPYAPAQLAGTPPTKSPFDRDLEMSEWLDQRISHEIAYLESRRERVDEAQALTNMRLQQIAAAHARTANWLTVLQTSVLGAFLGAFTAAGAVHESSPLRVPMIALVAMLALVLPPLAARWAHGYRWPEFTAAGLAGTAGGWLAAVAAQQAGWLTATPQVMVAAAALGAVLCAGAASLLNSRPRTKTDRPAEPK